jgi:hypothetical protein
MIPKFSSGSCPKTLISLALLMAINFTGCFRISKPAPPTPLVCPAASMAECDTAEPSIPATAAEMSADFALDLATYYKAQRNECAALNRAKGACLRPGKEKPR